jgi:hypothetical protein
LYFRVCGNARSSSGAWGSMVPVSSMQGAWRAYMLPAGFPTRAVQGPRRLGCSNLARTESDGALGPVTGGHPSRPVTGGHPSHPVIGGHPSRPVTCGHPSRPVTCGHPIASAAAGPQQPGHIPVASAAANRPHQAHPLFASSCPLPRPEAGNNS